MSTPVIYGPKTGGVWGTGTNLGPVGPTGSTGTAGATGATGATGTAATVAPGTATVLAAGAPPTVTNSGTSTAAIFNFGIPAGATGAQGPTGATGTPGVSVALSRTTVTANVTSVAAGAIAVGTVPLGKSFVLLNVATNAPARVELYATAALQSADASRASGSQPISGSAHGVLCDLSLPNSTNTFIMSPPAFGSNMESTVTNAITYAITNIATATASISVVFTVLVLEV